MKLQCSNCGKSCKSENIKTVEIKQGIRDRDLLWSAPRRICGKCLSKPPLNGNYRLTTPKWERKDRKKSKKKNRNLPTPQQKKVLDYIIESIEKYNKPPTLNEISNKLHINSSSVILKAIVGLIKKGELIKSQHTARGVMLNPDKYSVQVVKLVKNCLPSG